ncbi:TonB-dependent receptor [Sphingomonas sp. SUN039]|uniref:TonB-dependent receptor n=1 Tax=Sphingomonas sp. SUN039 TaxID=2937787 RepID=UPI002164C6E0|nr:TonB-dependent receptor [Sphingomonas sp. SUN039]UVO53106.1 TonB-dependent receptor [Sphingomonas sp. SUN039]
MTRTILLRALLAGTCGLAISSAAFAQTPAPADTNDAEIVVTAQNRAQNVNDVPIAINVVSAEQLKAVGFGNLNDIDKIAPAVQLNQDQGTVKVTVRGVGTNSNDESQDTSVVINIDGEYLNRPNALGSALFDIDRVEVLRGPQGTLYGRNSTGGAINFITRKPGKDFGVNATASYGNYNAIRLDAGVDVPLGSVAAVRVAGFYDKRNGYVSHPARAAFGPFPAYAGGSTDDNDAYGGRISLRLDPTEQLSINLAGEYAKRKFTPAVFAYADLNAAGNGPTGPGCNASGYTRVAPAFAQTLCVPNNTNFLGTIDRGTYAAPGFGTGNIAQSTYAIRGRLAYEFSDAAILTYTGGYRNFSVDNSFLTLPVSYRSYNYLSKTDTQSHELRLNGVIGGITYQLGGFYFKEKIASLSGFVIPIGSALGTTLSYFGRDITSESKSIFGQVEVPLGDKLTAVGGLRYTDNKRTALYRNASPFGAGPPDCFTLGAAATTTNCLFGTGPGVKNYDALPYRTTLNLGSKENKVTWLVGLNYKPNADTLIYGKVSTGFKGGGFDAVGTYKPESNTAYELGWKQSFGERSQHQFNMSTFYYDYRDLQVSVLLNTALGGQTFNAGKATIKGVEASADIALDRLTNFHASVNYLDARYGELFAQFNVYTVPGTGADVNGIGDLDPVTPGIQQPNFAGNRPPFSPEWVITAGLDHKFELGDTGTLTAAVNTTFKSAYFTDFYNYRDGKQTAFSQTDLSLLYKPVSEKFSVQAYVRNLEGTRPLTYGSFVSAGSDDIFNWQFGSPRTYGVRVSVDF